MQNERSTRRVDIRASTQFERRRRSASGRRRSGLERILNADDGVGVGDFQRQRIDRQTSNVLRDHDPDHKQVADQSCERKERNGGVAGEVDRFVIDRQVRRRHLGRRHCRISRRHRHRRR